MLSFLCLFYISVCMDEANKGVVVVVVVTMNCLKVERGRLGGGNS